MTSSSGPINLLEQLTKLRITVYLLFTSLLKEATLKVTDGYPDGRAVLGTVCGRAKRSRVQHSPKTCMCSPTQKLSESRIFGISMVASSHKYD